MTLKINNKEIVINSNKDIEKAMETLMVIYKINQWRADFENWDFEEIDNVFEKYGL